MEPAGPLTGQKPRPNHRLYMEVLQRMPPQERLAKCHNSSY